MRFVKTDELEKGMRLARPIYNRNGVLLYDRDTYLTRQSIVSIKNFGLIGIYTLEESEPLPPMTKEDIEFERFLTVSVFGLREDIELIEKEKEPVNITNMVNLIFKNYGRKDKKVSTIQNIRSKEDYEYKHCITKSILSAAMGVRLDMAEREVREMIMAALLYCIKNTENINTELVPDNVKIILDYEKKLENNDGTDGLESRKLAQAKVLRVAQTYDDMTAMKLSEEPCSEVVAVKYLLSNIKVYEDKTVGALVDSLRLLYPGVCVELTNKSTGIVIYSNPDNVLRPLVLGFSYNEIYNLMASDVYEKVQIKDIMKTMDRRIKIDKATIDEYMKKYSKKAFV